MALVCFCAHPGKKKAEAEAEQRIAEAWKEAEAAGTLGAYKFFINKYPEAAQAKEAGKKVEKLRFEKAGKDGSPKALQVFLSQHPSGEYADRVRSELETAELEEARKAGTEEALAGFISKYPASKSSDEVRKSIDDLALSKALGCGKKECLEGYLREHGGGAHADEARKKLMEFRVKAMIERGDYAEVSSFAARWFGTIDPSIRGEVEKIIPEIELEDAAMRLTREKLDEFLAKGPAKKYAEEAKALRMALGKNPGLGKLSKPIAVLLDRKPPDARLVKIGRGWGEDPMLTWFEMKRLGGTGAPCDLDAILEGLSNRYIYTRELAYRSLRRCMRSMPEEDRVYAADDKLQKLGGDAGTAPVMALKRGAILDAAGRLEEARKAYRKAASEEGRGYYSLLRLAYLSLKEGDRIEAYFDATQFASAALSEIESRKPFIEKPPDPDGLKGRILMLRQMYGNMRLVYELAKDLSEAFKQECGGLDKKGVDAWVEGTRKDVERFKGMLMLDEAAVRKIEPEYVACAFDPVGAEIERLASARAEAAKELERSGNALALPALKKARLTDPDESVRKAAEEAIGEIEAKIKKQE